MKLTPQSKLEDYQVEEMRQLYMDFTSVTEIAQRMKLPRSTVQNYVNKGWREARTTFSNELLAEVSANKKVMVTKLAGKSLSLILKAVGDLEKKESLSAFEANVLANLFEKLDKILKLDAGNPTDILATTKPATIVEIQEKLKLDPFLIEEGTIIEEENNEESDNDTLNINLVRDNYEREGD